MDKAKSIGEMTEQELMALQTEKEEELRSALDNSDTVNDNLIDSEKKVKQMEIDISEEQLFAKDLKKAVKQSSTNIKRIESELRQINKRLWSFK